MGMFDYARCHYPLPLAGFECCLFQTKDTDAMYLDNYTITVEGRLLHEEYEQETVPTEQRPGYEEYVRTGNSLRLLRGSVCRVNQR